MRLIFRAFFFFTCIIGLRAQISSNGQHQLDSLHQKFVADSAHTYRIKHFKPMFTVDNRNSFIKSNPVNFKGLQFGLVYKEYHAAGIGLYNITQTSQRPIKTRDKTNKVLNQYLTLKYLTLFYQYTLIDKRFYEVDVPVEIGFGNANIKLVDSTTQVTVRNDRVPVVPLGTGLQVVLKPVKWVGMSVLGGYRYANGRGHNLNFSGWYYSFGLWLDVRQIYRDTKFYGFQRKRYRRELKKVSAL